jgi:hypothetical protein
LCGHRTTDVPHLSCPNRLPTHPPAYSHVQPSEARLHVEFTRRAKGVSPLADHPLHQANEDLLVHRSWEHCDRAGRRAVSLQLYKSLNVSVII